MSRITELLRSTPPTTLGIVTLCSFLCVAQVVTGSPQVHAVTLCPRLVIGLGEYYRIISSALYHGGLMHIGMNMMSMAALGKQLEQRVGTWSLAITILYSILLTSCLYIFVAYTAYWLLHHQGLWYQHSVGFSGVLFHLSVLECHSGSMSSRNLFGMINLPPALYPWALLIVLQFIMPNLSFWGHLTGILVGTLQASGHLDVLLPVESTLQDLDAWMPMPWPSFVSTQPVHNSTTSSTSRGIGRALQPIVTLIRQLVEAAWVIIFGRGQRTNANTFLWPTQRPSTPPPPLDEPLSSAERSRLVPSDEETEMV